MTVRRVLELLAIMLGPSVAVGAAVWLPPKAVGLWVRVTHRPPEPSPLGPPIERVAADLRRLLALHEAEVASPRLPLRASRLTALRAAIGDAALDAASALELPVPRRRGREPLPVPVVAALLHSLVDAGLVLPGSERFPGAAG